MVIVYFKGRKCLRKKLLRFSFAPKFLHFSGEKNFHGSTNLEIFEGKNFGGSRKQQFLVGKNFCG